MDNGDCASGSGSGWSIITSSAANSQLAGVLAAVIFSGIVILFARRSARSSQALGLFSVTFVVLAFDSYLFGTITGLTAERFCVRAWSEGMTAAGMLGAGGFALVTGISWLMADHADVFHGDTTALQDHRTLGALSRYMILGIATVVSMLLTMTSLDYLDVVYESDPPARLVAASWAAPLAVLLLTGVLTAGRGLLRRLTSATRPAPIWPFRLAAFALLTYGIAGTLAAGWMMARSNSAWESPDQTSVVAVSMAVGLVIPSALIVAIVIATPEIVPHREPSTGAHSQTAAASPSAHVSSTARAMVILLVLVAIRARRSRATRDARRT